MPVSKAEYGPQSKHHARKSVTSVLSSPESMENVSKQLCSRVLACRPSPSKVHCPRPCRGRLPPLSPVMLPWTV
jgi:hypothetical protein